MKEHGRPRDKEQQRAANRRTGLWVGGLALAFFVAVFIRQLWLS